MAVRSDMKSTFPQVHQLQEALVSAARTDDDEVEAAVPQVRGREHPDPRPLGRANDSDVLRGDPRVEQLPDLPGDLLSVRLDVVTLLTRLADDDEASPP